MISRKDQIILQDSGTAIVDQAVALIPGLNLAWGLSKAYYGAALKLRQERALEWVEMVRDNPGTFSKEILLDESFQDGFADSLEKFIRQRSAGKREHMKQIFLGFAGSEDKNNFELERFYHVLTILNEEDINVLRDVDRKRDTFHQIYKGTATKNENIFNLVNSGVLTSDYVSRMGPIEAPFVKITDFGKKFIRYLETDHHV
tara:strand:+ start:267 stop:872 length:606 start_codon:yes stop_codon:yes gene_type:complete